MSDLYVTKILGWKEHPYDPKAPYWKAMTEEQRRAASTHCGPDESYPVGPGCEHVKAAWTLAMSGHGHPNMACIKRYAISHGCYIPPSHKALNEWQIGI